MGPHALGLPPSFSCISGQEQFPPPRSPRAQREGGASTYSQQTQGWAPSPPHLDLLPAVNPDRPRLHCLSVKCNVAELVWDLMHMNSTAPRGADGRCAVRLKWLCFPSLAKSRKLGDSLTNAAGPRGIRVSHGSPRNLPRADSMAPEDEGAAEPAPARGPAGTWSLPGLTSCFLRAVQRPDGRCPSGCWWLLCVCVPGRRQADRKIFCTIWGPEFGTFSSLG